MEVGKVLLILDKGIFLFLGIMLTFVNFAKAYMKNTIPTLNFIIQSIGITGFIILQWLI